MVTPNNCTQFCTLFLHDLVDIEKDLFGFHFEKINGSCGSGNSHHFSQGSIFTPRKCQKIGHFSSKKAFSSFFLAMVLAGFGNFAEEK